MFDAARKYDQEYAHYEDGWNQALEEDARAYSYESVSFYFRLISQI